MNKAQWDADLAEIRTRMAHANWSTKTLDRVVEMMGETPPTFALIRPPDVMLVFSTKDYYLDVSFEATGSPWFLDDGDNIIRGFRASGTFWKKLGMVLEAMGHEAAA